MIKKTKSSILWNNQLSHKTVKYAGVHLIAEFWDGKNIDDKEEMEKLLVEASKEANNTPLKVAVHKFWPQGIMGVVLLAESHIALHYWPEYNYLAVDIFTCGDHSQPEKALEYLEKEIKPKKVEVKEIKRGILSDEKDKK